MRWVDNPPHPSLNRNFKAAALYLTQRKKYAPAAPAATIPCPLDRKTTVVYYNNYGYICG